MSGEIRERNFSSLSVRAGSSAGGCSVRALSSVSWPAMHKKKRNMAHKKHYNLFWTADRSVRSSKFMEKLVHIIHEAVRLCPGDWIGGTGPAHESHVWWIYTTLWLNINSAVSTRLLSVSSARCGLLTEIRPNVSEEIKSVSLIGAYNCRAQASTAFVNIDSLQENIDFRSKRCEQRVVTNANKSRWLRSLAQISHSNRYLRE